MPERLTADDIGCWVIKSQTPAVQLDGGWEMGASRNLTRCLRRSYRVDLMRPGDDCLLWVSGRQGPGVQAIGRLRSAAVAVRDGSDRPEAQVTIRLRRLHRPVSRAALLADHVLAEAEVLRMPAGSNPSYLPPRLWTALADFLSPEDLR